MYFCSTGLPASLPFTRSMRLPVALLALVLSFAACSGAEETLAPPDAGPALSIQQPPSGSLSDAQLAGIAADIRRLEARPLAAGAAEGRAALFQWISGSPDVSVALNGDIVGPLLRSNSRFQADLLNQFVLSSAAHRIETPGADAVGTNVAGLEGALAAYTVILSQQGRRARDAFMESVRERSEAGTLRAYVEAQLGGR